MIQNTNPPPVLKICVCMFVFVWMYTTYVSVPAEARKGSQSFWIESYRQPWASWLLVAGNGKCVLWISPVPSTVLFYFSVESRCMLQQLFYGIGDWAQDISFMLGESSLTSHIPSLVATFKESESRCFRCLLEMLFAGLRLNPGPCTCLMPLAPREMQIGQICAIISVNCSALNRG